MKSRIHFTAGILATLIIATFIISTLIVEVFGSHEAIVVVKHLIVYPGLFILVPLIAATGITGFVLSKSRHGGLIDRKKRRMPFITANGILILLPLALYLNRLASENLFDEAFYFFQALELMTGATNFILMGLNIRDGLLVKGNLKPGRSD